MSVQVNYDKIQLFIPCFVDQLFPDTAKNMLMLLRQLGLEVLYNPKQTCCGQPAFNAGYWQEAKAVGKKWVEDLSLLDCPIVAPSSSCIGYARNFISDLSFEQPSIAKKVEQLRMESFEFSEFLVDKLGQVQLGACFPHKVVYHDACAALRECKIEAAPRQLLHAVKGLELMEMDTRDQCCGFGGSFSVKFEPISVAMAEKKVQAALATGAEYLVSADWSCLMHLQAYIKQQNIDLKVMHLIDVLATKS